jgi:hypothetical protein
MPAALNTNFAEQWQSTYDVLKKTISYKQFDFDQVKQVLISYLRTYHPEYFNNLIETDEMLPLIELFAYVGELFAYRVDVNTQEHILQSATRKSSVLQLAAMMGYTPSRRQAATGLVKIDSLTTTESILDQQGTDIRNKVTKWNDPSNPNWQLQFELILNKIVNNRIGVVSDSDKLNLDGTIVEKYSLNTANQTNGVYRYTIGLDKANLAMELVPVQLTNNSILEYPAGGDRAVDILKLNDGFGVASRNTGYFFLTKQGRLSPTTLFFDGTAVNHTEAIRQSAINDTDVWLTEVDAVGNTTTHWTRVDNIAYNSPKNDRNVFQVETLENDNIQLVFGDGNYSNVPSGSFVLWARSSESLSASIPVSAIQKRTVLFEYQDLYGNRQTCTIVFSLTTPIENQAEPESIQKIQQAVPGVYYTQDRMVNAQDHEGYLLQDSSIVKIKAVNRSFTGQSKYSGWNDSSEVYENVKIFGNDGVLYFQPTTKIREVLNPNNSISLQAFVSANVDHLLAAPDMWLGVAQRIGYTPRVRTFLNTLEQSQLINSLKLLASGGSVGFRWEDETLAWVIGLNLYGPRDLTITTSTSARGWVITINAASTVFSSSTTKFWNYSLGSQLDYDTLLPTNDRITILKANVNRSRTGVLPSDVRYRIAGNMLPLTSLPNQTSVDLSKVELIGSDTNGDGFPEDFTAQSILNSIYTFSVEPNATNITITLPVTYLHGRGDILSVIGNNAHVDWNEDSATLNGQLSSAIVLPATTTNTQITITVKDFVYLSRPNINSEFTIQRDTDQIRQNFIYDTAGVLYKRYPGRQNLNFLWEHYSDSFNLIDPVRTNINDLYIVTKRYYVDTLNWLQLDAPKPEVPSYFQLKSAYSEYLKNSMMSDEVILRPGKFKILYGKNAQPQARAKIQLIVQNATSSADSVKADVIALIRQYFDITNIAFGDQLFFSSLATYVQTNSKYNIQSMLLVPLYPEFQFGDLYQMQSSPDEVFIADVTSADIQLVDTLSASNLRQ